MIAFSVVIPLYNKELHIRRAIDSILEQSIQDFEIIVVDDGSADNGAEVVKSMTDSRIKFFQQDNQGVSAARNFGIAQAGAELVAFLDADDAWKPKFLETILKLIKEYPYAGLYAMAHEIVTPRGRVVVPKYRGISRSAWEGIVPNYFDFALGEQPFGASGVVIPKETFKSSGHFPVGEKLGEDLDLWVRIAIKYPIVFSNAIGATYFHNAANRACVLQKASRGYCVVKTLEEYLAGENLSQDKRFYAQEYVNKMKLETVVECVYEGQYNQARTILAQCSTKVFFWNKLLLSITLFFHDSFIKGTLPTLLNIKRMCLRARL